MLEKFICRLCEGGKNASTLLFFRKSRSKVGVLSGRRVQVPLCLVILTSVLAFLLLGKKKKKKNLYLITEWSFGGQK